MLTHSKGFSVHRSVMCDTHTLTHKSRKTRLWANQIMTSRKQAVKNAVPKPGHNYFLSHCQDRAIDEAGSVSGCFAQGSAVIPWVQRWQANIALISCSRAGRASASLIIAFMPAGQKDPPWQASLHWHTLDVKNPREKWKLQTHNKTSENQSVHKKCLIFLDGTPWTGHFPNPVTETPLRTTVQQTNPERREFFEWKML